MKSINSRYRGDDGVWKDGKMVKLARGEDWETGASWFAADGWEVIDVQWPWIAFRRWAEDQSGMPTTGTRIKAVPDELTDLGREDDFMADEPGPFPRSDDYPEGDASFTFR